MATVSIRLSVDVRPLQERLSHPEKRIAYAAVNGINTTLKQAQRGIRGAVSDIFTLRKPGPRGVPFVAAQAAIIKPFASVKQARPFGEISVGQKSRLLLPEFVTGGLRTPFAPGARSVAVPVGAARPTKATSVPKELYVKALKLKRKKGARILEGQLGTYLVPGVGIFQRTIGAVSRAIYIFTAPFRIPRKLHFVEIVRAVTDRFFAANVRKEVAESLARRGIKL